MNEVEDNTNEGHGHQGVNVKVQLFMKDIHKEVGFGSGLEASNPDKGL